MSALQLLQCTLAEFVPHRNIALVNDSVSLSVNSNSNVLEPDLNSSNLTEVEKQELRSLLKSFGSLFVSEDGSLGSRVCNRLSGYSGYSDIRKNLSVRIVI